MRAAFPADRANQFSFGSNTFAGISSGSGSDTQRLAAVLNGGQGFDTLLPQLTPAQRHAAAVQAAVAEFEDWVEAGLRGAFEFQFLNLTVRNIESYELI